MNQVVSQGRGFPTGAILAGGKSVRMGQLASPDSGHDRACDTLPASGLDKGCVIALLSPECIAVSIEEESLLTSINTPTELMEITRHMREHSLAD